MKYLIVALFSAAIGWGTAVHSRTAVQAPVTVPKPISIERIQHPSLTPVTYIF